MNEQIEKELSIFRKYIDFQNFEYDAAYFISDYLMVAIKDIFQDRCSVVTVDDMEVYYGISFKKDLEIYGIDSISIPEPFYQTYAYLLNNCLSKGSEIVILPITLPNHKNMMIYFHETNTFEYYEPHGEKYKGEKYNFLYVTIGIEKLVYKLVKDEIIPPKPNIKFPEETCPLGLQRKEKSIKGLCQIWSFFFVYFRLKFPQLEFKIIENYLFRVKDIDIILTGFANFLLDKTRKILKQKDLSFKRDINKDEFKSRRIVSSAFIMENLDKFDEYKSKGGKTCINVFNSTVLDIFNYVKMNRYNIVIKIGDQFYCSSMDEWFNNEAKLVPLINDDKHYINQKTLKFILVLFERDDTIRFFEFIVSEENKIYYLKSYFNMDDFILVDI